MPDAGVGFEVRGSVKESGVQWFLDAMEQYGKNTFEEGPSLLSHPSKNYYGIV